MRSKNFEVVLFQQLFQLILLLCFLLILQLFMFCLILVNKSQINQGHKSINPQCPIPAFQHQRTLHGLFKNFMTSKALSMKYIVQPLLFSFEHFLAIVLISPQYWFEPCEPHGEPKTCMFDQNTNFCSTNLACTKLIREPLN